MPLSDQACRISSVWVEHVDRFLLANEGKAARERLTLIRIYEEVRALGYDGSYDAVRRYAKTWAKARGSVTADAYVPLYYAPGEAYQFDWSHEIVLIGGVTVIVPMIERFMATDRGFAKARRGAVPGHAQGLAKRVASQGDLQSS